MSYFKTDNCEQDEQYDYRVNVSNNEIIQKLTEKFNVPKYLNATNSRFILPNFFTSCLINGVSCLNIFFCFAFFICSAHPLRTNNKKIYTRDG